VVYVIQFLINDEMMELTSFAPNLTVLDWLRTRVGKTGSKEGCGTGDCGACTVVIGHLNNDQWHYKSINACLMLLGNLHGKHLITVEALNTSKMPSIDELHPVQRAMVEHHGSQCGFCTPGFIMSLFALYMNHSTYPGKEAVIQALGGNLCRCTGYQPILTAAEQCFSYDNNAMHNIAHPDHRFSQQVARLTASLQHALTLNQIPCIEHITADQNTQHFYLPQSLTQLCQLKATHPHARFVAGSTDLAVEFNQRLTVTDALISVRYCPELMQFSNNNSAISIGAALPYSDFIDDFCAVYPEASELFERLGSMQVRNAGCLGGSIANASPIGDPAPLLIALNATLELRSVQGSRFVAMNTFFTGYRQTLLADDEVIVAIHIPARDPALKLSCHKISKRMEDDISAVCLVLSYQLVAQKMEQVKCVMGGMVATPASAKQVENALNGRTFSLAHLQHAAQFIDRDYSPMSDVRASSAYRIQVTKNLFDRIWYQALEKIQLEVHASTPASTCPIQTRINHASL